MLSFQNNILQSLGSLSRKEVMLKIICINNFYQISLPGSSLPWRQPLKTAQEHKTIRNGFKQHKSIKQSEMGLFLFQDRKLVNPL